MRLPQVGSDKGRWGDILNEFLLQSHTSEGLLRPGIVNETAISNNSVSNVKLQDNAVTNSKIQEGSVSEGKLDTLTREKLNSLAESAVPGLPAGGDENQVLAKKSAVNYDADWIDSVPISNANPLPVGGMSTPGTLDEVARADHQHPLPASIGYALRPGLFSNPIGIPSPGNDFGFAWPGRIMVSPLPVYSQITINRLVVKLAVNGFTAAIYDSSPGTLLARNRLAILTPDAELGIGGFTNVNPVSPVRLNAGLYWVAVLSNGPEVQIGRAQTTSFANMYISNNGYDSGNKTYEYPDQNSLPETLQGVDPFIGNDGIFWYGIEIGNN